MVAVVGGCATDDGDGGGDLAPPATVRSGEAAGPTSDDAGSTTNVEAVGEGIGSTAEPEPTDATRDELLTLDEEQGARADLKAFTCVAEDGVWGASGTVTNASEQDHTYYLRIGVIERGASRSSVAFKNVVLDVKAGTTEEFTAPDIVTTQQDDLDCLPRVVRGDLES